MIKSDKYIKIQYKIVKLDNRLEAVDKNDLKINN